MEEINIILVMILQHFKNESNSCNGPPTNSRLLTYFGSETFLCLFLCFVFESYRIPMLHVEGGRVIWVVPTFPFQFGFMNEQIYYEGRKSLVLNPSRKVWQPWGRLGGVVVCQNDCKADNGASQLYCTSLRLAGWVTSPLLASIYKYTQIHFILMHYALSIMYVFWTYFFINPLRVDKIEVFTNCRCTFLESKPAKSRFIGYKILHNVHIK